MNRDRLGVLGIAAALGGIVCLLFYLLVPPPAPAHAQFNEQRTWGGTAGGSANALTIAVPGYTKQVGVPIRFLAASAPTSAATINITGSGITAIKRATNVGVADLVGGEWSTGAVVMVVYDGTFYKLLDRFDVVGASRDFRQTTVPAGHIIEDGSCVSRTATATAALFAAIGTTYGACDGSTTFALPDSRGRVSAGLDNQGGAGAAGRLTNAGSGCTFTAQGASCGLETNALTSVNQFPPYTPQGNMSSYTPQGNLSGTVGLSLSDTRTWSLATAYYGTYNGTNQDLSTGPGINASIRVSTVSATGGSLSGSVNFASGGFTGVAATLTFNGTAVGASSPFRVVSPVLGTLRAVKL